MGILGPRDAVPQQAGMEHQAAVGLDDRLRRAGDIEHARHGEIDAVERRTPDHLPEIGQNGNLAAGMAEPNRLDAGREAEQAGRQAAVPQQHPLTVGEVAAIEIDGGRLVVRVGQDRFLPVRGPSIEPPLQLAYA